MAETVCGREIKDKDGPGDRGLHGLTSMFPQHTGMITPKEHTLMYTAFIKITHTLIQSSLAGSLCIQTFIFLCRPPWAQLIWFKFRKSLESLSLNKTARVSFILTFSPIILNLLQRVGKFIATVYTKKLAVFFKDDAMSVPSQYCSPCECWIVLFWHASSIGSWDANFGLSIDQSTTLVRTTRYIFMKCCTDIHFPQRIKLTTIGWIYTQFGTSIHGSQRMHPDYFYDPLAYFLSKPWGFVSNWIS